MRKKLDAEISSATTINRRDSAARRFGIPAVVAAAVAALAIGGYLVASDGDGGGGTDPAGQGSVGLDDTKPEPTNDPQAPEPTVLADPDEAYQGCIDLVAKEYPDNGDPDHPLTGRLAIDDGESTTVVVATDVGDSYTCNIKPDSAVDHLQVAVPDRQRATFAVADNVFGKRELVWGGGPLPASVSSVRYTFPDGHRERAVTKDGYWAVQYFAPKWFTKRGQSVDDIDPITVTLDGSGGTKTLTLRWGLDTCDQVSHGC